MNISNQLLAQHLFIVGEERKKRKRGWMYGRNSEHGPMVLFVERHEKKFGGVTLVFRDGRLYIAVKTEEQENKVLNTGKRL